jgi:amino acid transporter
MDINQETLPEDNSGIALNVYAIHDLKKAAKWCYFLAIVGFIGSGIIAICALFIGTIFAALLGSTPYGAAMAGMGTGITVFYLILAAISFILNLFLYQFATRTQKALNANDSDLLAGGIHRLQSYFKMIGIMVIIELSLVVLGFICMIAFGALVHNAIAH